MNLTHLLAARRAAGKPVRVGLIGAGKFGSMFLSQVPTIAGARGAGHRRSRPASGRATACRTVGWDEARIARDHASPTTATRPSPAATIDVVVEATGNPAAGIAPCARAAIAAGKHIVMVNVEADVLAGPLLARKARDRRRRLFAWPMATSRR